MKKDGYGSPVVDVVEKATRPWADRHNDPAYGLIRGREQMLIDILKNLERGKYSGNAINGIGFDNPRRTVWLQAAKGKYPALEHEDLVKKHKLNGK